MKTRILLILVSVMLYVNEWVLAQPGLPSTPDQAPIDGVSLLAAAGGAYAVKKLRDKKKRESDI